MSILVRFKGAELHTLQQHHRQHMLVLVEACVDAATYMHTYVCVLDTYICLCLQVLHGSTTHCILIMLFRCVWVC